MFWWKLWHKPVPGQFKPWFKLQIAEICHPWLLLLLSFLLLLLCYIICLTGGYCSSNVPHTLHTVAEKPSSYYIRPVFIGDVISRLRIWVMSIHIITTTSILQMATFTHYTSVQNLFSNLHQSKQWMFRYTTKLNDQQQNLNAHQQNKQCYLASVSASVFQPIYQALPKVWQGGQRFTKGKPLRYAGVGFYTYNSNVPRVTTPAVSMHCRCKQCPLN